MLWSQWRKIRSIYSTRNLSQSQRRLTILNSWCTAWQSSSNPNITNSPMVKALSCVPIPSEYSHGRSIQKPSNRNTIPTFQIVGYAQSYWYKNERISSWMYFIDWLFDKTSTPFIHVQVSHSLRKASNDGFVLLFWHIVSNPYCRNHWRWTRTLLKMVWFL